MLRPQVSRSSRRNFEGGLKEGPEESGEDTPQENKKVEVDRKEEQEEKEEDTEELARKIREEKKSHGESSKRQWKIWKYMRNNRKARGCWPIGGWEALCERGLRKLKEYLSIIDEEVGKLIGRKSEKKFPVNHPFRIFSEEYRKKEDNFESSSKMVLPLADNLLHLLKISLKEPLLLFDQRKVVPPPPLPSTLAPSSSPQASLLYTGISAFSFSSSSFSFQYPLKSSTSSSSERWHAMGKKAIDLYESSPDQRRFELRKDIGPSACQEDPPEQLQTHPRPFTPRNPTSLSSYNDS